MSKYKGFSGVRTAVDGKDGFVSGHQVISTAGATKHAERMKRVPVWALDDEVLQKLVLKRFPKWKTDPEQKAKAGKLLRILTMYYRKGSTAQVIADELSMPLKTIESIVYRWDKRQGITKGLGGRPKNSAGIETTNGEVTL